MLHRSVNKLFIILIILVTGTRQHARLLLPPSRASMWRMGFETEVDENDNESYCGGFGVHHYQNSGKCGICGDAWNQYPREHETPGLYATGIIVEEYEQGDIIPVVIDITANHQGHVSFKLCPNDNIFIDPTQDCFDRYPLSISASNDLIYPIRDYKTGLRLIYVKLPEDIICHQCILQWDYVAGNNWGICRNGTEGLGCGPQETFRSCADVKIVERTVNNNLSLTSEALDEEKILLNILKMLATVSDKNTTKRPDVDAREKEWILAAQEANFAPIPKVESSDESHWWEKIFSNKH